MSIYILCPFLNFLIVFLLLSCKSSLYSLGKSFIRYMVLQVFFFPFCGLSFHFDNVFKTQNFVILLLSNTKRNNSYSHCGISLAVFFPPNTFFKSLKLTYITLFLCLCYPWILFRSYCQYLNNTCKGRTLENKTKHKNAGAKTCK